MTAHGGKQHFPETTDHEGHEVNGHEVRHAVNEVVPYARTGTGDGKCLDKGSPQAAVSNHGIRVGRQETVGLVADVPHSEEHCREGAQPNRDHDALEVNPVTHMGGGGGDTRRRVENSIHRLVKRIPALVLATLFKVMLDSIEKLSDSHRISPRSRFGSGSRGESDHIHICRGTQRCTAPDLLHPTPVRQASVPSLCRRQSGNAATAWAECPAA